MRSKLYNYSMLRDAIPKLAKVIQMVILSYLILLVMIYFINRLISIAPLELSDYVVSNKSDIVIFSDIENKFYIYSADLKLMRTFTIPSYGGGPMLAIDESNNIYMVKRRAVLKLDMQGHLQLVGSVSLDDPDNWRLTKEGIVKHFNEATETESKLFSSNRLRRIAKPGDIIFYEKDRSAVTSIKDPFVDMKGNKYICENWFNGITVINSSGKLMAHLTPPPLLRAFTLPYPGLYCWIGGIAIIGLMQGIEKRFWIKKALG
jgi:hypothetical protein